MTDPAVRLGLPEFEEAELPIRVDIRPATGADVREIFKAYYPDEEYYPKDGTSYPDKQYRPKDGTRETPA